VLLAQYQLSLRDAPPPPPPPPLINPTPSRNLTSGNSWETAFDLTFPLVTTPIPSKSDISWATNFLRLPVWSRGYVPCDSNQSEVSCFEVVRAARTVQQWEKSRTTGQIWVQITDESFPDRLSMLYHGLQIALVTNRAVITDHSKFSPLSLPQSILNSPDAQEGSSLPTDYQFGCADVSPRFPNLQFSGSSWPQVLYTHPIVAPFLRAKFGYHAAHFLGNYLFGESQKPKCLITEDIAIEGWQFPGDFDTLKPVDFERYVKRCGVNALSAALITTQTIPSNQQNGYHAVVKFEDEPESIVCAIRKLMSTTKIIHEFGSRVGFWATAMLGVKGGFVNALDKICINTTNSQQGSLWHTYVPPEKHWYYRTNTWFYICGPNVNDARLYVEYLLW
jgi:hypothetical protein